MSLLGFEAPILVDWIIQCESLLRAGQLADLEQRIQALTLYEALPVKIFYRARIAVANGRYEQAIQLFQQAITLGDEIQNRVLVQRSLVWQAYTHYVRTDFSQAQAITRQIADHVDHDDPISVDIFFVRGLLASATDSFAVTHLWFERAHRFATQRGDRWQEARTCANWAAVYVHEGLMDRAATLMLRVTAINNAARSPSIKQLIQICNIDVIRLRLLGRLAAARARSQEWLDPASTQFEDGTTMWRGWLALSLAIVEIDADNFAAPELASLRAQLLIGYANEIELNEAEWWWERAWLRLRQDRVADAEHDIERALALINDRWDNDQLPAYAIAGLVALRGSKPHLGRELLELVTSHFARIGHRVGLASVQFHLAQHYDQQAQTERARQTASEALNTLRAQEMYGAYYWDPAVMITICQWAITEQLSFAPSDPAPALELFDDESLVAADEPSDRSTLWLAEFATCLVIERLTAHAATSFGPLLSDPRPAVRERAARILHAASAPANVHDLPVLATVNC